MTDFITVAQVDSLLGVDWATEDKKPRAVLMANAWLTQRVRPNLHPVPEAIVQAGAEVAREAAQGKLMVPRREKLRLPPSRPALLQRPSRFQRAQRQ